MWSSLKISFGLIIFYNVVARATATLVNLYERLTANKLALVSTQYFIISVQCTFITAKITEITYETGMQE